MQKRKIVLTLSIAVAAIAIEITGLPAQGPRNNEQPNALKVKEDKLPTVNYDAPEPRAFSIAGCNRFQQSRLMPAMRLLSVTSLMLKPFCRLTKPVCTPSTPCVSTK